MHTKAILVVDDEPDAVLLLKRALQKAGVTAPIHVVDDGAGAIAYLRGDGVYADRVTHPLPEIILLDLKLPCVSGLEVLKWVKNEAALRTVPVIVLTSSKESRDVETAYQLGANSYLVKPMSLHLLTALMETFRDYWLRYNEAPRARRTAS